MYDTYYNNRTLLCHSYLHNWKIVVYLTSLYYVISHNGDIYDTNFIKFSTLLNINKNKIIIDN